MNPDKGALLDKNSISKDLYPRLILMHFTDKQFHQSSSYLIEGLILYNIFLILLCYWKLNFYYVMFRIIDLRIILFYEDMFQN